MVKAILSKREINNLVKKVVIEAKKDGIKISRAFVFGSYAKNKANKSSDLDLCFISQDFKDRIKSSAILRAVIGFSFPSLDTPVDVVVYRPRDFSSTIPLVYDIKNSGKEIKI